MHEHNGAPQHSANPARRTRLASLFGFGASLLASSALVGLGIATGREAESSDQPPSGLQQALQPDPAGIESAVDLNHGSKVGFTEGFEVESEAESKVDSTLARATAMAGAAPDRPSAASTPAASPEARMFNGRPLRAVRTVSMRVTAYSPDERSCGAHADGITASGYSVETNGGALVAADPRLLPLGSLVSVPGYDDGAVVPVLDVGGAIKGARLDVLFPTHERAVQWGVRELEVTVWEYADGEPSGFRRQRRPSR